jgi:hypothetical protein
VCVTRLKPKALYTMTQTHTHTQTHAYIHTYRTTTTYIHTYMYIHGHTYPTHDYGKRVHTRFLGLVIFHFRCDESKVWRIDLPGLENLRRKFPSIRDTEWKNRNPEKSGDPRFQKPDVRPSGLFAGSWKTGRDILFLGRPKLYAVAHMTHLIFVLQKDSNVKK